MSFGLAWIGKKEGAKERFKSEAKGSRRVADTGLAPDCIYSSTKRFTFTKSFQLHGAHRISTLLSSFGDVILLAAMAGELQATTTEPFLYPFFSLFLSLGLSLLAANGFKVVAGNRFANPWRRRIGPFRTPAPRFHFVHYPTTRLCLSFWLSLSIMGFRRSLANYRNPVYRVNPFVLRYYGLTIMQRISRHCVYAVPYRSFLCSERHYASIERRSIIAT